MSLLLVAKLIIWPFFLWKLLVFVVAAHKSWSITFTEKGEWKHLLEQVRERRRIVYTWRKQLMWVVIAGVVLGLLHGWIII